MAWFAEMLTIATENCSEPVAWATCAVAVVVVATVLRAFVAIFK